ncbi:alpha/beta hydrolase [Salinisphaera sp. Q1T1-3]|uniref:PHA/PHB synthase family protein n=1 Tax=Salinisphaera sp. Q1T1-3 TaxID=2321229 RepID=UPI000E74F6B9|nr:alpha/beta fold hydrolase [Salinisphaera sp. Q1T1-3]RJS94385.1 alpha/beta fold hydrolase [Salinisphaera sp. Q1T1-3]
MGERRTDSLPARRDRGSFEPDVADPSQDTQPPSLGGSAAELLSACARQPAVLARIELALAGRLALIALGRTPMSVDTADRRFAHPAWRRRAPFRRALQGYLAWSHSLRELIEALRVDAQTRERLRFVVEHVVAAGAPSNLCLTHPGFYDNLVATRGRSLLNGLRQLVDDWRHNDGLPRQVDPAAFRVGRDLAATPGAVIFRNDLFELIQYAPRRAEVDARPLLFVPPQINKYYVLDLAPDNSLVRHALEAGQQVFMISWRNPTAAQRDWGLDAYVGAVGDAVDIVWGIGGEQPVKLVGACAGGLTAAIALALAHRRGRAARVACLSLFVTLLGELTDSASSRGTFGNRAIRHALAHSSRTGVLDGADLARAFAWLRPDDLIWRFVTNNYVLGQRPPAHDILFWNADTTRLPARLHADLLSIYTADSLRTPRGVHIDETAIDLSEIDQDVFIVAGARDHITPWTACFRTTRLLDTNMRFVLADAGHVQTVVSPPRSGGGYLSDTCARDEAAADWQERAPRRDGSWWPEWFDWCRARGGPTVAASMRYGNDAHEPIEAAPGRYVRQR